jgi:hypothetical protein
MEYEINLCRDTGERITTLSRWSRLEWALRVSQRGAVSLEIPVSEFPAYYFSRDRRLELWRRPNGGALTFLGAFFLRRRRIAGDVQQVLTLGGPCCNYLLSSRIIAAAAGSAGADKTGYAGNVMKDYVDEAVGPSAGTGRIISGVSIQGDLSDGASISKSASRDDLEGVLAAIADSSAQAGSRIRYGMQTSFDTSQRATFEFSTRAPYWGNNRGSLSLKPVIFSVDRGNLAEPVLEDNWEDEKTYCYGGGPGEGAAREIVTSYDTTRINQSAYGRREVFFDGRNYTGAALQDAADRTVWASRPARRFSGKLISIPGTEFGIDWGLGDLVTIQYAGEVFDVEILAVSGIVDNQQEEITCRFDWAGD